MTDRTISRALGAAIVLMLVVSAPSNAGQQRRGAAQDDGSGRGAGQLSPKEVVAMLDAYAAVQAQTALELDDAHYADFVVRLRALQEGRRKNQQRHNQIVQDLRRLAGSQATAPYDETAIRERLKALRDLEDRAAAELQRARDGVDEVLTVAQQARFRVFEEMIERRKLDLLMRARLGAAGRKGNTRP
jgi:hypothetical protein